MTWAIEEKGYSQRRACALVGHGAEDLPLCIASRPSDDARCAARCGSWRPSAGGSAIGGCTCCCGGRASRLNHKKLYRLYREERLAVRKRGGRKRALGSRAPMALPQGPNQRWSLDFVSDALADGRRFRVLAVVDDFTPRVPGAGGRHLAVRRPGRARAGRASSSCAAAAA